MTHSKFIFAAFAFFTLISFSPLTRGCEILVEDASRAPVQSDLLYQTLTQAALCPQDVRELKALLAQKGASFSPAMVANRGAHNPRLGSFSFFETVESIAGRGEVFFGHFTNAHRGSLEPSQEGAVGQLMIELIAWDPQKGYFNFYELIGGAGPDQKHNQWLYRGDSKDILLDNRYLHLDPPAAEKKFGSRLRCSGCHTSGGPIMKELAYPHNDWWTAENPLSLGPNKPTPEVQSWMANLIDAGEFASRVKTGIHKLEASPNYQALKSARTLQEQLRPLFCDQEINIESSPQDTGLIQIPSAFFLNPLLGSTKLTMNRADYERQLSANGLIFPETTRRDAAHAWLTPVKGYSDLLAIQSLIHSGRVSASFAINVLSFDRTNPIFSKKRCALLKNLGAALPDEEGEKVDRTTDWFAKLLRIRRGVFESEISKNPRGQILEPGFRVIFPEATVLPN